MVTVTFVLGTIAFMAVVTFWKDIRDTCVILWNYNRRLDWMTDRFKATGGKTWQHILVGVSRPAHISIRSENVQFVLKDEFDSFEKGDVFHEGFEELLGDGIFNIDGPQWNVQRKLASHMFSTRNLRDFMAVVFADHGKLLVKRVERLAQTGDFINIQDVFFRATIDTIGTIAFGVNVNSLEKDNVPFTKAFDHAQEYCQNRFFSPLWKLERLWGKVPVLGNLFCGRRYRAFRGQLSILDKFASEVVKMRQADPELEQRQDVLSRFLKLKPGDFEGIADIGVPFFRDVIMNFIIAGRDTTANAMSWCVYEISRHPEVQAKVLEEVDRVVGSNTPSYQSAQNMPYMYNVIHEALRLHPSVPFDVKQAQTNVTLPDGTRIGKGQYFLYAIYSMGRDTKVWGDDAAEFRPSRWEGLAKPTHFVYPVFNAGPRTCLGQTMAVLEATMLLSALYQRFAFELQPGRKVTYNITVTLPVKDGLYVRALPRSSSSSSSLSSS